MKYAVVERERRFLPLLIPNLSVASRIMQIEDRYIHGTRLRLRTVREPGKDVVRKLGQKVRLVSGDMSAIAHTTMYLDEAEFALLSPIPGRTLTKTRHVMQLTEGLEVAVDVFQEELSGLMLAEFDLGDGDARLESPPAWLGVEVTHVEEFTGYALACLDAEGLARLLAAHSY